MPEKKVDLRVQRTKENIRRGFEEMICEMDYEEMSIKELTQRAKINRKTFYLHYDTTFRRAEGFMPQAGWNFYRGGLL